MNFKQNKHYCKSNRERKRETQREKRKIRERDERERKKEQIEGLKGYRNVNKFHEGVMEKEEKINIQSTEKTHA